jgi:hypothetical protein
VELVLRANLLTDGSTGYIATAKLAAGDGFGMLNSLPMGFNEHSLLSAILLV